MAITSAHLNTLCRITLSCSLPNFRRDKNSGLSNAQIACLFFVWAVAIPFCKVLVYSTETVVTETGLSRGFIGGVLLPIITNVPVLFLVTAHTTRLGAVQALQYNTASFYYLCATYELLDQKPSYYSWAHLQPVTDRITEHFAPAN